MELVSERAPAVLLEEAALLKQLTKVFGISTEEIFAALPTLEEL